MRITTPQEGLDAARRLLDFGVESALVTLDRDGMAWADASGDARLFPPGPGRSATSPAPATWCWPRWATCWPPAADYPAAIEIANVAGGLEVERLGVVPLDAAGDPRRAVAQRPGGRQPSTRSSPSSSWKASCGGGARPASGS